MTEDGREEPTVAEEVVKKGGLGWKVFLEYCRACNNWFMVISFIFLLFLTQIISSVNDWWASKW